MHQEDSAAAYRRTAGGRVEVDWGWLPLLGPKLASRLDCWLRGDQYSAPWSAGNFQNYFIFEQLNIILIKIKKGVFGDVQLNANKINPLERHIMMYLETSSLYVIHPTPQHPCP